MAVLGERFGVVLVRPPESGNVGATARAMANCGLTRLVLVEPAAPIDRIARALRGSRRGDLSPAKLAAHGDLWPRVVRPGFPTR